MPRTTVPSSDGSVSPPSAVAAKPQRERVGERRVADEGEVVGPPERTRVRKRDEAPSQPEKRRLRTLAKQKEMRVTKGRPQLDDAARARERRDVREGVSGEIREQVDAYGARSGWDPAMREGVVQIFDDTSDRITRVLSRVDRGEVSWNDVRREVRQYRLDSAAEVRGLLGDERFRELANEMDFQRFVEDSPTRGRL
jgi:hypothetical protein